MQLKCHYLGLAKLKQKKILSVSQHGFESGSEDFTAPIEDISPKQRYSFYRKLDEAFNKKESLTCYNLAIRFSVNFPGRNVKQNL